MSGPGSIDARSQTVQPTPPDFAQYVPDAPAQTDVASRLGTTTIQFAITDEFRVKPEFRIPPTPPQPKPSIVDSILSALSGW
jgi:hypothetical protein